MSQVHSESEVVQLLQLAQRHQVPVTFRAAGTSLSGQAITDSILIKVWDRSTGQCEQLTVAAPGLDRAVHDRLHVLLRLASIITISSNV